MIYRLIITCIFKVFIKISMKFGMSHQLRVDRGKLFYFILGMQELFSDLRSCQDIAPYRQAKSKTVCFLVIVFIASKYVFWGQKTYLRRVFHHKFYKMEITFSDSTKNSFINFYFFHFRGFSVCVCACVCVCVCVRAFVCVSVFVCV